EIADVGDHAYDPGRAEIAAQVELNELAERILSGPQALRERTADHRDALGIGAVAALESAAAQHRDADGGEIPFAREAVLGAARAARRVRHHGCKLLEARDLVGLRLLHRRAVPPAARAGGERDAGHG